MKKVLGFVMALALMVSGVTTFGGGVKVNAAETNVSRETALEIEDNGFKTGSFTQAESEIGRWYKFTNKSNECVIAEVTMTHTDGSTWPNYNFFYENGKGTGNSAYFTGGGKTEYIGMEANQTVYLHINNKGWRSGYTVSVKMVADDANSLATAKKVVKSGKTIYGEIQNDKDIDVFKIKAKKSGTMTISITNNDLGNDLSHLSYTIFNKSRRAKAKGSVDLAKTNKIKLKVKKNQIIYVQLEGYFFCAREEKGSYVVGTKIKK